MSGICFPQTSSSGFVVCFCVSGYISTPYTDVTLLIVYEVMKSFQLCLCFPCACLNLLTSSCSNLVLNCIFLLLCFRADSDPHLRWRHTIENAPWKTRNTVKTQQETGFTGLRQHDVFQQRYVAGWHLNICPITPASANVWQYITFKFSFLLVLLSCSCLTYFIQEWKLSFSFKPQLTSALNQHSVQNMLQYKKYNLLKLHLFMFWVFIFLNLWRAAGCV